MVGTNFRIKSHFLKTGFLVIVGLFGFFDLNSSSLVYVHIGPELPAYTQDALFQARLFNPTEDIYLVVSQSALVKEDRKQLFENIRGELQVKIVPIEALQKSEEHKIFTEQTTLNTSVREGFWKFTSERFLVLDDFMQQYHIQDVIHCENDVLLYRNVQELVPVLRSNYNDIAAIFENDDRCIPSFIYVRDEKAMKKLATYFAEHAASGQNDMKMLAGFRKENQTSMGRLPIISRLYVETVGLKAARGFTASQPDVYYKNIDLFKSVFDGAALGQYFGGQDPRNGPCKPGYASGACLFDAGLLTYRWKKDESGRNIPFMAYGGQEYRINNLHIHSKDLKKFLSMPTSIINAGVNSGRTFITGDQFRYCADYVVEDKFCCFDARTVEPKSVIFVKTDVLKYFFDTVFPDIQVPIILITHNSDLPAPGRFNKYLNNPKIIAWFCQNCDTAHDKLIPIPVGLANAGCDHGDLKLLNMVLDELGAMPVNKKSLKAYLNTSLLTSLDASPEYKKVRDFFKKKKYVFTSSETRDYNYLLEMAQHTFVICLAEKGFDCYEIWQALLVGAVPIVMSSPLDPLFEDLPVIIVNKWKNVMDDFLQKKYGEISGKKFNRDKLFFDYWWGVIKKFKA